MRINTSPVIGSDDRCARGRHPIYKVQTHTCSTTCPYYSLKTTSKCFACNYYDIIFTLNIVLLHAHVVHGACRLWAEQWWLTDVAPPKPRAGCGTRLAEFLKPRFPPQRSAYRLQMRLWTCARRYHPFDFPKHKVFSEMLQLLPRAPHLSFEYLSAREEPYRDLWYAYRTCYALYRKH